MISILITSLEFYFEFTRNFQYHLRCVLFDFHYFEMNSARYILYYTHFLRRKKWSTLKGVRIYFRLFWNAANREIASTAENREEKKKKKEICRQYPKVRNEYLTSFSIGEMGNKRYRKNHEIMEKMRSILLPPASIHRQSTYHNVTVKPECSCPASLSSLFDSKIWTWCSVRLFKRNDHDCNKYSSKLRN